MGKLVAEYATDGQTGAGTSYITTDALGTPRVMTDASGGVRARHDYLPFGEEIGGAQVSLKGGRNASQMYVSDGVRQKFTGQERDNESGLDYFLARDYQSAHGRFTSPDPLLASGQVGNPQTWNRYAYVGNNPVTNTDPFGLCSAEYSSCDEPYSRDRYPDEVQSGLASYNQRLQNQQDVIAANRAARNGDRETFWNIVNGNENVDAVDENGNMVQEDQQNQVVVFDKVELLDDAEAGYPKGPLATRPEVPLVSGTNVEHASNTYQLDIDVNKIDPYEMLAIRVTFHSSNGRELDPSLIEITTGLGKLRWNILNETPTGRKATQLDYGKVIFRVRLANPAAPNNTITVKVGSTKEPGLMDINNRNFRSIRYEKVQITLKIIE